MGVCLVLSLRVEQTGPSDFPVFHALPLIAEDTVAGLITGGTIIGGTPMTGGIPLTAGARGGAGGRFASA
ncbi:MAG TPA: hypothetical protein VI136_14550, partial [Verrucomicrobiae bacterium]